MFTRISRDIILGSISVRNKDLKENTSLPSADNTWKKARNSLLETRSCWGLRVWKCRWGREGMIPRQIWTEWSPKVHLLLISRSHFQFQERAPVVQWCSIFFFLFFFPTLVEFSWITALKNKKPSLFFFINTDNPITRTNWTKHENPPHSWLQY